MTRTSLMVEVMNMMWNGKQWFEHISDKNVIRATEFLLSLDNTAFIEPQRPNAYRWIDTLKERRDNYYSQAMIGQSLLRLQRCAVKLATVLSSDVQIQLLQYLGNPETSLPSRVEIQRA